MVPVEGVVTYEGQPADEAQVAFHPVDTAAAPANRPLGITDEQGRFRLTTLAADDGAPVGRYKVTVTWRDRLLVGEESTRSGKSLIPVLYNDPVKTPLEHEVRLDDPQPVQLTLMKQPVVAPKK